MMLWDDDYFYFGVDIEEPDVWGTLTERDSVICQDNDFEIFLDPDDDECHYMEFEMNPLSGVFPSRHLPQYIVEWGHQRGPLPVAMKRAWVEVCSVCTACSSSR